MPTNKETNTYGKFAIVSRYAATIPPVPKNADCPNDSSPVNPNRISNPSPNKPQTRMRLIVVGVNPRYGSTKGAAIKPTAVNTSTMMGRLLSIADRASLAPGGAEQPVRPQHQHQRHRHEQHDIGV